MVDIIATEYEAKCNALLLSTTFLKAHPTKYQTDNTLTLSAVATVAYALCKKENPLNGGLRENGRP